PLIGNQSATWDASADAQTLSMAAVAVPEGLKGRNCLAEILYTGGDANLKFQVTDGTNVLNEQVLGAQVNPAIASVSFVCPTSGSLSARLIASADAASIKLDSAYVGENYRVGTVAQATLLGSLFYPAHGSC